MEFDSQCVGPTPRYLKRVATERLTRGIDDNHAIQGTVLWLPARKDLPDRAVRRAHGKGPIEEGIYDHPVVVVSRPLRDSREVHFHLVSINPVRRRVCC
jgi:hypothetical protein